MNALPLRTKRCGSRQFFAKSTPLASPRQKGCKPSIWVVDFDGPVSAEGKSAPSGRQGGV